MYVEAHSPIHRMDARVKIIFTLAFLILISLTPSKAWLAFFLIEACILSLTMSAKVRLLLISKRVLLALPFVLAALPLIFLGPPPTSILVPDLPFTYSIEGLNRFIGIAIKTWISVQAAILLSGTTRFSEILTGLQQLKVPGIFIAIIGLMWRYLFLMMDEVNRLIRARASRSAQGINPLQSGGSLLWRARVTGGMAGSLFLRSIERSDRVYAAMLSRGYTGDLLPYDNFPLSSVSRDILMVGLILLLVIWVLGLLSGGI